MDARIPAARDSVSENMRLDPSSWVGRGISSLFVGIGCVIGVISFVIFYPDLP